MSKIMTRFLLCVLATVAIVSATAVSAQAQEKVLKVQTFFSPTTQSTVFWVDWAEKINKKSNGRLKIEVFPSMQLGGKPGDLYNQARDGVVDGMFTLIDTNPGRFPKAGVYQLPSIADNAEIGSAAIMDMYLNSDWLKDEFDDLVVISLYTTPGNALNTKEPVTKLSDFKGKRIRAATKPVTQVLEKLGAAAVGMPMPDAVQGMQQGVIDGIATSWAVSKAFKICDISDHHTDLPGLSLGVIVFGLNKDSWRSLPKDLQDLLHEEATVALAREAGRSGDEVQEAGLKHCAESGEIHRVDAAEYESWKKIWAPVTGEYVAELNGKGVKGDSLLADARALVDKAGR